MSVYRYESATPEQRALGWPWWCIHHDVKLEILSEPVENRVRAIRETKAPHERETRLRAMRPLIGPLPAKLTEAYAAYQQAYEAWAKADAALAKACAAHQPEIDALFAIECADVPWGPGGLVFPEEAK